MGKSNRGVGLRSERRANRDEPAPRLPASLHVAESDLERYGTDLLALDGWRSLKTDPVSRREWGKGFGEKGMADRLYIRYASDDEVWLQTKVRYDSTINSAHSRAQVLWIEWKTPRGKAEPHQRIWINVERGRGALVLLAGEDFEATPEGFLAWYRGSGLLRRTGL